MTAEALLRRGVERLNRGAFHEAIRCFDKAIAREPRRAKAYMLRALALKAAGRTAEAQQDIDRAIGLAPSEGARKPEPPPPVEKTTLLLNKARALADDGRRAEALKICKALKREDPGRPELLEIECQLAQRFGKPGEASRALARALRAAPRRAGLRLIAAQVESQLGRHARALAQARQASRLDPAEPRAYCLAASSLARLGRVEEALDAMARALSAGAGDPETRRQAARFYDDVGMPDRALEQCLEALRLSPDHPEALRQRAYYELKTGLRSRALASARAALARTRDADTSLWTASTLIDVGEFKDALALLEDCARREPHSVEARARLAELRLWHGRLKPAVEAADAALALSARCAVALRIQGAAACLAGDHRGASKLLRQACALAPEDRLARAWLGETLRRLDETEEAIAALERSLSGLAPWERPAGALINLALAKLALGRDASAETSAVHEALPWRQLGLAKLSGIDLTSAKTLERALGYLKGNRGHPATMAWDPAASRATKEDIHYNARVTTMGLQSALRFGSVERVLAEFDELLRENPDQPYAAESRGEVCLWAGRYGEAERFIKEGLKLDPGLPWPNIGLCGIYAVRGEHERALKHLRLASANGAEEHRLATWRGELYRRMGRPAAALAELKKSRSPFPFRPGLWLNVALAGGDGDGLHGRRALFERLRRHMPDFLEDAAEQARVAWPPARTRRGDAALVRLLETALEMMKGNRSSWMYTYVLKSGELKHIKLVGVPSLTVPPAFVGNAWMFADRGRR